MLDLEDAEAKINISDFVKIESLAGGQLPERFKEIYLHNNGGFPEATMVRGDDHMFSINGFNPVKHGALPIEKLMVELAGDHDFLQGYVPFAYDDGGNSFMLSLNEKDFNVVCLWLQDEVRLEKVCASFDGFIEALIKA